MGPNVTPAVSSPPKTIILTGATGRTGRLVFSRLVQASPSLVHAVTAVVRSKEKADAVLGNNSPAPGSDAVPLATFVQEDVTHPTELEDLTRDADTMIILTSATPQQRTAGSESASGAGPPEFFYPDGGFPEDVDWRGGKAQIDAAAASSSNVSHVILVGSMGSSSPDSPLNKIGNGNILKWKRRLQEYLISVCEDSQSVSEGKAHRTDAGSNHARRLQYTIINPAGLTNELGGTRKLVVGKNDDLFAYLGGRLSVPRDDVAEVVVRAAIGPAADSAKDKCFDLASAPGEPELADNGTDFVRLFQDGTPGLV